MKTSTLIAVCFVVGLCFSAWLAARRWDRLTWRHLPMTYGFAFGFAWSAWTLRNDFVVAAAHGLWMSAVGLVMFLGLWAEARKPPSRGEVRREM